MKTPSLVKKARGLSTTGHTKNRAKYRPETIRTKWERAGHRFSSSAVHSPAPASCSAARYCARNGPFPGELLVQTVRRAEGGANLLPGKPVAHRPYLEPAALGEIPRSELSKRNLLFVTVQTHNANDEADYLKEQAGPLRMIYEERAWQDDFGSGSKTQTPQHKFLADGLRLSAYLTGPRAFHFEIPELLAFERKHEFVNILATSV